MASWHSGQTSADGESADMLGNAFTYEWHKILLLWTEVPRTCVCGTRYFEFENLGSFACSQHALPFNTTLGFYPCCERKDNAFGCVKADHRVFWRPFTLKETVQNVPDQIIKQLGPRPGNDGHGVYVRFDRSGHAQMIQASKHQKKILVVDEPLFELEPNVVEAVFATPRVFKLSDNLSQNREELLLWDGDRHFAKIKAIVPKQLDKFILFQNEETLALKVAQVRKAEIKTVDGIAGIHYSRDFYDPELVWTPLKDVKLASEI